MVYKLFLVTVMLSSFLFASFDKDNLKSFEAKFVQKVKNESGKTIEYSGDVYIKNDGKVLWKYATPIVKNVYILNDMVIVDEPELEQAIYSKLEKSINILTLLKDAKKLEENLFETTLYDIKYLIKIENDKISSLSYKDELSNNVTIDFKEINQNIEIDDEIFRFIAPKDYDIIEK